MCESDAYIFFFDKVFLVDFGSICLNLGSSFVAPLFLDFQKLVLYYSHEFVLICKQLVVVCDFFHQLLILVFYLLLFQTLKSSQLHVENCLSLNFGKAEAFDEPFLGVIVAVSDNLYDFVDIIEGNSVSFQYVSPGLSFFLVVDCSSGDNFLLMFKVNIEDFTEI